MSIWEKQWFHFVVIIAMAAVWGSSFILMKIGLKSFSNEQVAAIRMIMASLALLPFSLKYIKEIDKKNILSLLVAGFIGSFIPAFLFTKAQTQISSSLAGMLNSLTPIFTLIVGFFFHQPKASIWQVMGLLLGLVGAIGLISSGSGLDISHINMYALLVVLATLCYGISINTIKSQLSHMPSKKITSLAFFLVGPVSLVYLLSTDLAPVADHPDWPIHLLALAVLGVVGTAFALLMMNKLIRYTSAIFTSTVTYLIPIMAIFWGVVDGESISMLHILSMVVILSGVYLISKKKKELKPAETLD